MWRATIRGVLARKVRLALTALAVVLGVAFVSGVYVLTDTLRASFDALFAQTAVGSDLVVRSQAPFGNDDGQRTRMPETIVDRVRKVPGVARADGVVQGKAQFVAKDGKTAIQNGGAPTLGISWPDVRGIGPLRIVDGRPPQRPGEVAMDAGTADREGFHLGDRVKVLLIGPAETFRIVGTFGFGSRTDLGGVTFAAFDPATAQRVFGARGLVDYVNVVVDPSDDPAVVRTELARDLGPGFEVVRSEAVAQEIQKPINEFLGLLNNALLGFAAVGLLVGGFIIFNTFTILVSQRTRELGLLRAMGASGSQVVASVVGEAAVMGASAAAFGLAAGVGLAHVLYFDVLPALGLDVPSGDLVVIGRTMAAAIVVGLGVTVAASLWPALRASRIPPVAAIGDTRRGPSGAPLVWRTVIGIVVILGGLAVIWYGIEGGLEVQRSVAVAFLGGFLVFLGVVSVGPVLAGPLARVLGRPLPSVLGVTGTLARGNATRNPRRTSATAAALVVGLGLVSLVAIFADSAKASVRHALATGVRADYILTAEQLANFSPQVANRVGRLPGAEAVVAMRFGETRIQGVQEYVTGATMANLDKVVDLGLVSGSTEGVTRGGVLVSEKESDYYKVKVGDPLTIAFPRSGTQVLPVVGVYRNRQFTGGFPVSFIIDRRLFRAAFGGTQEDTFVFVKAKPGQAAALGREMRTDLRGPFPNVSVRTLAQYQAEQEGQLDTFLNVFFALLFLSEIIAVLGIVNTLTLSVYERTRELGLLRAVGMSRRQVRRMVRGESVVIAIIGCVLGIAIGVLWGWAVTRALRVQGITEFSVPPVDLAIFVVASGLAGLVAALLPAWHASRLDVLSAIAHE